MKWQLENLWKKKLRYFEEFNIFESNLFLTFFKEQRIKKIFLGKRNLE